MAKTLRFAFAFGRPLRPRGWGLRFPGVAGITMAPVGWSPITQQWPHFIIPNQRPIHMSPQPVHEPNPRPYPLWTWPPYHSRGEMAHKHKQIFPVTARVGGGSPDRVAGGLPTGGQGSKVYVLCAEPKEHKHLRPGTRPGGSGTRPGGSVTGVTEKLFMC